MAGRLAKAAGNRTLRIAAAALLAAFSYALTAFLPIPYPGGAGYFNFSDAVNLFGALLLGPYFGAVAAMAAGALSDLTAGYAAFVPFTVLSKGLCCAAAGLFFHKLRGHKVLRYMGLPVGAAAEVAVYFFAYLGLYGPAGLYSSLFDLVQAFGGAALSLFLYLAVEKTGLLARFGCLEYPRLLEKVDDKQGQDEHKDVTEDH